MPLGWVAKVQELSYLECTGEGWITVAGKLTQCYLKHQTMCVMTLMRVKLD